MFDNGDLLFMFFSSFFIVPLLIELFLIIAQWKLFVKAGKPGWFSVVPVYNYIVLFEIIGYKWYYIFVSLLVFVPFVGVLGVTIFAISYNIKLAKSFGKGVSFGIGLCFLKTIFMAIIAFDKDIKYIGPSVNGDIDLNDMF